MREERPTKLLKKFLTGYQTKSKGNSLRRNLRKGKGPKEEEANLKRNNSLILSLKTFSLYEGKKSKKHSV
tara:strand:+ start:189 stop:398 length:210 start_codon:yes stop_codon:yes gene_type:complete